MRIVTSPSGQGSLAHLVVAAAQPVNRANGGVRNKRANHSRPSTTRATTLSGLKLLDLSLASGNRLITLLLTRRTSTPYAPNHQPDKPHPRPHVGEDDIARLLADHVHGHNAPAGVAETRRRAWDPLHDGRQQTFPGLVVATCFQEQYPQPSLRQFAGERAACTGARDDVMVAGPLRFVFACHLLYVSRFSAMMASTVLTVETIAAVVAARRGSCPRSPAISAAEASRAWMAGATRREWARTPSSRSSNWAPMRTVRTPNSRSA